MNVPRSSGLHRYPSQPHRKASRQRLQVLRIHNFKGWTVKEEGLPEHAWEKFKILLGHRYTAKDGKLDTESQTNKRKLKTALSSKIFSGFS